MLIFDLVMVISNGGFMKILPTLPVQFRLPGEAKVKPSTEKCENK